MCMYVLCTCVVYIDNVIVRSCSLTVRCLSLGGRACDLREYGAAVQFAATDD